MFAGKHEGLDVSYVCMYVCMYACMFVGKHGCLS